MHVSRFAARLARVVLAVAFSSAGIVSTPTIAAPDPNKVLRIAFPAAEAGFDPVRISDLYSATVLEGMFERLLTYDYLARPAKVVPMLAESMPAVTDNGKTYTFKLRKGVYFAPDPIWKGAKRELVAQDVVYSYMRFLDPKNRAPYAFLLEGKIVGLDEHAANAKKSGQFDYDAKIPGIEAVDRYTVRFRLKETDYNFLYIAAHISLGIVAREAIEGYGEDTMGHPVGTGPYMLTAWTRRSKIVLESNPEYRGFTWDFAPSDPASWDDQLVKDMRGKSMPQVGRVEITIIDEAQSRWLAFQQKQLDYLAMPETFAPSSARRRPAEACVRGSGHPSVPGAGSGHDLHRIQCPRSGHRRLHEGKDRAAPRDGDVVRHRSGNQGRAQRSGRRPADADSVRRRRSRPRLPQREPV